MGYLNMMKQKPVPSPDKIEPTMKEFKQGNLHSRSKQGPLVTNRKQTIAIAISQAKKK